MAIGFFKASSRTLKPREFTARMNELAEEFGASVNEMIIGTATAVSEAVIAATPVDTGRARNNWVATINKPVQFQYLGSDFERSGNTRKTLNAAIIESRQAGQTIYIQNSLDYIQTLNQGWSQQAPAGFAQAAALKGAQVIRKFLR